MRKFVALGVAVLVAGLLAVACGGGGKSVTIKGADGQSIKVTGSSSLPDSFPKDFPIYNGADYKGGVESSQEGISGFAATWETGDSMDKVSAFYKDALSSGKWKQTSTFNSGDSSMFMFENTDDSKTGGWVTISRSGDTTSIVVLVGNNLPGTGSDSATTPSDNVPEEADTATPSSKSSAKTPTPEAADLPEQASLPSDYPKDRVPLPDGIRVTNASSYGGGGQKTFAIEYYTKDAPTKVGGYFDTTLTGKGWTQTFTTEQNGQVSAMYSGASGDESVLVTTETSDVPGYIKVTLVISLTGS